MATTSTRQPWIGRMVSSLFLPLSILALILLPVVSRSTVLNGEDFAGLRLITYWAYAGYGLAVLGAIMHIKEMRSGKAAGLSGIMVALSVLASTTLPDFLMDMAPPSTFGGMMTLSTIFGGLAMLAAIIGFLAVRFAYVLKQITDPMEYFARSATVVMAALLAVLPMIPLAYANWASWALAVLAVLVSILPTVLYSRPRRKDTE